jgi:pyruvate/2-oxoglutarate dehydrogenase complex dihydrolipoamide acyltransferase (E2) component
MSESEEHDEIETEECIDPLSPSVRRLVRQYDVDVTGIHGSGPQGRIRVGDVMALIGGRTHVPDAPVQTAAREPIRRASTPAPLPEETLGTQAATVGPESIGFPTTCVFECDMSRALAHQKSMQEQGQEVVLTSYYVFACTAALNVLREMHEEPGLARLGVSVTTPDGATLETIIREVDEPSFATINEQLAALLNSAASGAHSEPLNDAKVVIHHHGASGSIIAFPTPLAAGQTASLGVGAVRRVVAVRNVNGEDSARIVAQCYLSLSFYADRIGLPQANLFLQECARILEHWPIKRDHDFNTAAIESAT